ncbi:MAG: acyl-CoA dehydratase activase [Thermodesulfobacteriota bacterium]
MNTPVYCGCDVGSMTAKAVLMAEGKILGSAVIPAGTKAARAAADVVDKALEAARLRWEDIFFTVSTGYGRKRVGFAQGEESEIACHGRGAWWCLPNVRTVIDIGGQDSKAIRLDGEGRVVRYQYNDKCASGTGRFLEVMAQALGVALEDMGGMAALSTEQIKISNQCVIFAETEVVSLMNTGHAVADILNGLHHALATRVLAMAKAVGLEKEILFCGGVAKNGGVAQALAQAAGFSLVPYPLDPQINGALGAALLAEERARERLAS